MADFTIHRHPVQAVPCPDCRAAAGVWCRRPSGHRAAGLHLARGIKADRVFIDQHGPDASGHPRCGPLAGRSARSGQRLNMPSSIISSDAMPPEISLW
ncbi:zinc finger domain-containing protein [Paracoccus broussonetiae]